MNNSDKKKKLLDNYARYSSIAIQMLAIILAGVFIGVKLDQWLELTIPVFTVILSLLSVVFSIYFVVKDLIRTGKKDKDNKNLKG